MTSARRPYSQLSIAELEQLTQDVPERRATNEAILAELRYRSTARAQRLQRRIERLLDSSAPIIAPPPRKTPERAVSAPMSPKPATRPTGSLPGRTTATNQPQDILRAWTVLEVLSPATFRKPADLAGGDMRRIARFDRGLPWSGSTTKGPPRARLYFQIVLGSIAMQPAIDQLLQRFADSRPEKPRARGDTPLAVVIVDREGRPIEDACAVVSTFGWGLPQALTGDPASLSRWATEEERIQTALHEKLHREGKDGNSIPLDEAAIIGAYRWLIAEFGLDEAMLKPPSFAVRSTVPFKSREPPEALLVNSFFLKDLAKAVTLFAERKAPNTLKRFLGSMPSATRRDLLHDNEAIEGVVAPAKFPSGRWPGRERHPLVLMQQVAVNLAVAQQAGEILAVSAICSAAAGWVGL